MENFQVTQFIHCEQCGNILIAEELHDSDLCTKCEDELLADVKKIREEIISNSESSQDVSNAKAES